MKMTAAEKTQIQAARRIARQTPPPIRPWKRGVPNYLWCETPTPGREDNVCGVLLPVGHRCLDCGKIRAPL